MTKRKTPADRKPKRARAQKPGEAHPRRGHPARETKTKTASLLALLARTEGASLEEMQSLSGWQPHSVRGFLAGAVKKKLGLKLTSKKFGEGARRYHVDCATA